MILATAESRLTGKPETDVNGMICIGSCDTTQLVNMAVSGICVQMYHHKDDTNVHNQRWLQKPTSQLVFLSGLVGLAFGKCCLVMSNFKN